MTSGIPVFPRVPEYPVGKAHEAHPRKPEPEGILHDEIHHVFMLVEINFFLDFPEVRCLPDFFEKAAFVEEVIGEENAHERADQPDAPEKAFLEHERHKTGFIYSVVLANCLLERDSIHLNGFRLSRAEPL